MGSRSSSSGEEDGPAEWREAVESIAATTTFGIDNGSTTTAKSVAHSASKIEYGYENDQQHKPHKLKHYHIKVIDHFLKTLFLTFSFRTDSIHVLLVAYSFFFFLKRLVAYS